MHFAQNARRIGRYGGRVAVMEYDISLIRLDPPCPVFEGVWAAFPEYQRTLGGDGWIGRRLFRLFREAAFDQIELSVQPEVHWFGSEGFAGWIENVLGNLRGAERGLIESGLCSPKRLAQGELEALIERNRASSTFVWNRVLAIRS
jgi:hypothetical protein